MPLVTTRASDSMFYPLICARYKLFSWLWLWLWLWSISTCHCYGQVYGHFGPKTVRHYIFGTEMSYFFCVGAEVSLGHFGTSAEVSRTDRRRIHVLVSLHHLTSHLHHPSRSSDSVSRHFVYIVYTKLSSAIGPLAYPATVRLWAESMCKIYRCRWAG